MQFAMMVYFILLIIWLVWGVYHSDRSFGVVGNSFLQWVLFVIIGVAVFGNPFGK